LTALSTGEELIDPETCLNLGSESEVIGTLRITQVNERFSIARVIEGCEGLTSGDRVELSR
ncbi:MAG: hypothetical protein IH936_16490, partial [Acidobacteria bacterium]|nr:hypothetical protein [Acidobacteriota bacterium]